MYRSTERFQPNLTTCSRYSWRKAEKAAKARAHELRVLGGKIHEWNQIEQIPIPNSQCTESVRVYYVGIL